MATRTAQKHDNNETTPETAPDATVSTELAEVEPVATGVVLTPEQAAQQQRRQDEADRDAAWRTVESLPGDATDDEREAAMARAASFGDISAGDIVDERENELRTAIGVWRHTARVMHAYANGPLGLTNGQIAGRFGVWDTDPDTGENVPVQSDSGAAISVARAIRGWTLVLDGGAQDKAPEALRPYVAIGNAIRSGDMLDAANALKGGKAPTAVLADIRAMRKVAPKRVGAARGDAQQQQGQQAAQQQRAANAERTTISDVAAGFSDSALAGWFGKFLSANVASRKWADESVRLDMITACEAMLTALTGQPGAWVPTGADGSPEVTA